MVDVPSTEAPLKRKLDSSSGTEECKKSRDSSCPAVERPPEGLPQASAQRNDDRSTARQADLSQNAGASSTGPFEDPFKKDGMPSSDCKLKLSEQAAGGPSSASLQELEEVREGEVLEQDESAEEGDSGELSGLDTENDIEVEDRDVDEDEDEDEDVGSDEDDEESDYVSDNEEDRNLNLISTSSSSQAWKDKGKTKVDDVKGKSVMALDKGKGKAIVEDEIAPESDEDDTGYLSEDPLEEVDLNNILPTRTRRRSTTHQYDFVDQGNDDSDDNDDSDA